MSSWFDRIIWKNYVVRLNCRTKGDMCISIPHAVLHLRSITTEHLWDVFERHVLDDEPLDVERTVQWTTQQIQSKSRQNCLLIMQILMTHQVGDPRPSMDLSAWNQELETLDRVDIRKLNRITLTALSGCVTEPDDASLSPSENSEPLTKKKKTT
ncbi:uncharacterized protein LOC129602309 [Paramacrobiotus metropolitanus]|uniref:uncharacterized protein LOC129602309 n=1 Tax=Paramacrobiotus metropolitanus TaxID=2943436 RepID=UPI00244622D5|nr:uncharacterized protein LOC129602309 [Paramacrobiotus metropolitanus]